MQGFKQEGDGSTAEGLTCTACPDEVIFLVGIAVLMLGPLMHITKLALLTSSKEDGSTCRAECL